MNLNADQIKHREACARIIDKSHPELAAHLRSGGYLHVSIGMMEVRHMQEPHRSHTEAFHAINAVMCPLP